MHADRTTSVRKHRWLPAMLAVLTAFFLPLLGAAPAYAQDGGVQERSILRVYTVYTGAVEIQWDDGTTSWADGTSISTCTGWFASEKGHIVTAGHCVDFAEGRRQVLMNVLDQIGQPELFSAADANWTVEGQSKGSQIHRDVYVHQPSNIVDPVVEQPTLVQVLNYRPLAEGDLGLLKLDGLNEPAPALAIATESAARGEKVVSIGFAGTVSVVTDPPRDVPVFTPGEITSQRVSSWGTYGATVSAPMSGGMSGGPTVDSQNRVVGINSYGSPEETQSFNFITDAEALVDYLDTQSVETVSASAAADGNGGVPGDGQPGAAVPGAALPGQNTDSGLPSWLLPAAIGTGVAVVALVVFLLIRRNRSKVQPAPAGHSQQYGGPQQFGPGQYGNQYHTGPPPVQSWQPQPSPQSTAQMPVGEQPSRKFCQQCGTPNELVASQCTNCGRPFTP